jgi:hypothetical protein
LNPCRERERERERERVEAGAILSSQLEQVHAEAAHPLAGTRAAGRRGEAALEAARGLAASAEGLRGRLAGLIAQAGVRDVAGGTGDHDGQLS